MMNGRKLEGADELKKWLLIVAITVLFTFLPGCSVDIGNTKQKSTIEKAELTYKESTLLAAAGVDQQLVFDLDPDESIEFIYVYIEHYVNGVKKEEAGNLGVHLTDDEKNSKLNRIAYIITNSSSVDEENERTFSVSYITDNSTSFGSQLKSSYHTPSTSTSSSISDKTSVGTNQPVALAYLLEVDGERLDPPDEDLLTLQEDELKEATADYDHVYLFKAKFYTEVPNEYQ